MKIPIAREYKDRSGFTIRPDRIYEFKNRSTETKIYLIPLSRPSKTAPIWYCKTLEFPNNLSYGLKYVHAKDCIRISHGQLERVLNAQLTALEKIMPWTEEQIDLAEKESSWEAVLKRRKLLRK